VRLLQTVHRNVAAVDPAGARRSEGPDHIRHVLGGAEAVHRKAVAHDTERWALEFVPHGIRVNTVSPGSILVEGNGWDRYRHPP
jgi:NAD(P)-dependent dehydrogenase (short-subunit alcohol dehydrogenase family)